jgi:NAD(P)H-flavin reductase
VRTEFPSSTVVGSFYEQALRLLNPCRLASARDITSCQTPLIVPDDISTSYQPSIHNLIMDETSRPDIGDVFRFMLRARASDTIDTLSNLDDSNERRRKAIESILFSRRFIIIYNIVLLGLLACFTPWYWSNRISRLRRHRRAFSRSPPTQSSHSTPIRKDDNEGETTALLDPERIKAYSPARVSAIARTRAWLMYQPSNIPYVHKALPSNATTIGVLLLLGINLFFLLFKAELSVATAFVFADRAGLLFVANLPLLYLLAAKNQPLKTLTNASYESLNIFHRRLGEWMCLLALLHAGSMVLVWYMTLSSRLSFSRFLALPIIWLGLLAFISYETLYLSSLGSFRKRWYELFLSLHILLQAGALAFLWFHHHNSQPYVLAALFIFAVDRFVFRLVLKSRTLKADLSVLQDGETVMLSSNWQLPSNPSWWRSWGIKDGWKPAEHVFLTVPALSHKHLVQAHPFTIASAAPTSADSHAWLNFLIRAQDGFSRDLLRYAKFHSSVSIRVDGPYGSSHAMDMLNDNDVAVVVAGGSGIAVAFPLVWSLLSASSQDIEPESNSQPKPRVSLIWVIHDQGHIDWIPQDRLDELRELGCKVIIPPPTRKAGRPDLPHLLETAVNAWNDEIEDPTVGVVVAGPDTMNRSCRNTCASLVSQGARLEVSVEKFGW